MATINKLDSDSPFNVGLVFKNKAGKTVPAPAGASASWTLDATGSTILSSTPSADTLHDTLAILGPDGTAVLTVTVSGLSGSIEIIVSADPTPASVEIVPE